MIEKLQLENKLNLIDIIYKKSNLGYKIIMFIFIIFSAGVLSEYRNQINTIKEIKQMINNKFDKDIDVYQRSILIVKDKIYAEKIFLKIKQILKEKNKKIDDLGKIQDELNNIKLCFLF